MIARHRKTGSCKEEGKPIHFCKQDGLSSRILVDRSIDLAGRMLTVDSVCSLTPLSFSAAPLSPVFHTICLICRCNDVPLVVCSESGATSDVISLTEACKCSEEATTNECTPGQYCWVDNTCNSAGRNCSVANGTAMSSSYPCICGESICETDHICTAAESMCVRWGKTCFGGAEMAHERYDEQHCGGMALDALADGSAYGLVPPKGRIDLCEASCLSDELCTGFIFKWSDGSCLWNSNITVGTMRPEPGHRCYLKQDGLTAFRRSDEANCGGLSISKLSDGSSNGITEEKVEHCKMSCLSDSTCSGFTYRIADSACFWAGNSSMTTKTASRGHNCYLKQALDQRSALNEEDDGSSPSRRGRGFLSQRGRCQPSGTLSFKINRPHR